MLKARLAALVLALLAVAAIPVISDAASSSPDTIFGSATPSVTSSSDGNSVELGVKFTTATAGDVDGIRYYRGRGNGGTHVGSLYTASGQLLAAATFGDGTATGWQTVTFANPVAVSADTTYVAAYYAPRGHYSLTPGGLSSSVSSGPLTALASSSGNGNGLYSYARSSTFPINTYDADNYWVDVVFVPTSSTSASTTNAGGSTLSASTTTTTATTPIPAAPSNSVVPTITGTPTQGDVLTATNGTWSGSPTSYSYQWQDCSGSCTNISGATSSSYTLQSSDVGDTIDVKVTATNAGGNTTATSPTTTAVAAPTPAAPTNSSAPSITGTPTQGDVLTATNGTWSGSPTSYSYQWQDCSGSCTNISGATSSSYTLQSSDVGDTIDVKVTATNAGGNTTATSPTTTAVAAPTPAAPTNSSAPSITGTPTQGDVLTATNGTWSGSPTSYSYQWQDCSGSCTNISGATSSSYTLQSSDVGDTIDVKVTATNAGGNTTATSPTTTAVAAPTPAAPTNSSAPSITGTPTQGDVLTATNGTWSGSPTSYSYQWQDCSGSCTNISGATSSSYTLQSSDVGDTIDVKVTATNAGGNTTATSPTTTAVAAPTPAAPTNSSAPSITGTPTQGDVLTATNGTWSGSPTSYSYQWQDCSGSCTNISGATSSSYTLQSSDVGDTIDVKVTATNAGGNTTATSPTTTAVAASSSSSSSSAAVVGTAGVPAVTCTKTITPSTSIQSALSSASAGSTVCLNGDWTSTQSISATAPSSPITIAPAPGDSATVAGISIGYGEVSNLTFEGIQFTGGVSLNDCASNLSFDHNNFQNISDQSAFYLYYGGNGDSSCSQTGITMQYNQIDHTGECLEEASGSNGTESQESGVNFSHNVCGPDIGYGCNAGSSCDVSGHYVQMSDTEDDTIDNNAFLGPVYANLNPTCNSSYSHVNVFHMTGSSTSVDFSNNIIWHTQACGESVMFQSGSQINDTINNNLLIEDTDVGLSYNLYGADGLTFNHNTTVEQDGGDGVAITPGCTDCGSAYTNPQNVTADYNLVTGGQPSFAGWSCTGTCAATNNVSSDTSALSWGPATNGTGSWSGSWLSTTWSPNSSSPWSPPPTGYYQPTSGSAGYQGSIGP